MKRVGSLLLSALLLGLTLLAPQPAQAKYRERYIIENTVEASEVADDRFYDGKAKATVKYSGKLGSRTLYLRVWREVNPSEIPELLSVRRVWISGYNSSNNRIYYKRIEGFSFEAGMSGEWSAQFEGLPKKVRKIYIYFY